ncbi:hypothetical protein MNV_190002 [Candidatus Methanoperedens nitroreducens]|uniref:Uncharacterized protein n=1 Tax=Candidatus Methanoperedens nitratireducens TaxID=1392998 RepID=A0A284VMY2_9EURY|nr:hypothetical protein MNV_190002 [Candidatus Methanoperedens nitroreducens]
MFSAPLWQVISEATETQTQKHKDRNDSLKSWNIGWVLYAHR